MFIRMEGLGLGVFFEETFQDFKENGDIDAVCGAYLFDGFETADTAMGASAQVKGRKYFRDTGMNGHSFCDGHIGPEVFILSV